LGAHCLILALDRPLTDAYWVNLNDPGYPFMALVEHTNLIPASDYGGRHLVDLGRGTQHDRLVELVETAGRHQHHPQAGALLALHDHGLRVPEDVSIVGFDDIPLLAEIASPPLTSVRQPLEEMMRIATAHLIDRLEGTRTGPPEHVTVAPELIVRSSTVALR
jgi:hypothetical protein